MSGEDPGLNFRQMSPGEADTAIALLNEVDPEDAAAARASVRSASSQFFVLEDASGIIGVTGITPIEDTDASAWLSWTVVHPDLASEELIQLMLINLIDEAQQMGLRMLFATESTAPNPSRTYYFRMLIAAMKNVGFEEQVTHQDYYQRGEGVMFMSMRLRDPQSTEPIEPDDRPIRLTDSDEIAECDDSYYLDWRFDSGGGSTEKDVQKWIKKVRRWDGRLLFLSAPSTATRIKPLLVNSGFNEAGTLHDFYADGIHEVHYLYYL